MHFAHFHTPCTTSVKTKADASGTRPHSLPELWGLPWHSRTSTPEREMWQLAKAQRPEQSQEEQQRHAAGSRQEGWEREEQSCSARGSSSPKWYYGKATCTHKELASELWCGFQSSLKSPLKQSFQSKVSMGKGSHLSGSLCEVCPFQKRALRLHVVTYPSCVGNIQQCQDLRWKCANRAAAGMQTTTERAASTEGRKSPKARGSWHAGRDFQKQERVALQRGAAGAHPGAPCACSMRASTAWIYFVHVLPAQKVMPGQKGKLIWSSCANSEH